MSASTFPITQKDIMNETCTLRRDDSIMRFCSVGERFVSGIGRLAIEKKIEISCT